MYKKLLLVPLIIAALGSCNNENNVKEPPPGSGETETRFLAVNIIDNTTGTRATDPSNDNYEDGIGKENEVKTLRFYLFGNEDGFINQSVDVTPPTLQDGEEPNVEKKLEAVIVFVTPVYAPKPIEIVAIVNPPTGLAESYRSPAALQEVVNNYAYNGGENEYFIMSNSVYIETNNDTNKKEHVAYEITTDDSFSSREEALSKPVDIYVERVVAKVRVKTSLTQVEGKEGIYYLSSELNSQATNTTAVAKVYNTSGELVDKNIYIKLLGWNATGTAPESRLVKKIQTTWNFDWETPWNNPTFFRSYWAQNPTSVTSQDKLIFGSFNTSDDAARAANLALSSTPNSIYIQENASWEESGKTPGYPTKLIVAAQLIGDDEKPVDLAWWKGAYYLKEALLQKLASESRLYYSETGSDQSTTYHPLTASEIEFKSATIVEGENVETRYYSYARFKATSTEKNWYIKNGAGDYTAVTAEEGKTVVVMINDILKKLGETKVWDGGNTYYWTDIAHLGKAPDEEGTDSYGDKGIVRNHLYDCTISSFVGFGIPVLDPSETIYPEEPDDPEYAFIGAKINILSWRLVTHDNTQLSW